ncbi:MAG: site-specific integrase [Romboutsia sp.]|nr:site-specific integrase [Romboutsia sp.]
MAVKTNKKIGNSDYYRIRLDIGFNAQGKRIRKEFYGKTKKEAEQKKQEYLIGLSTGVAKEKRIGVIMEKWINEVLILKYLKLTSYNKYLDQYNKYFKGSPIMNYKFNEIKPLVIQEYYNNLLRNGVSSNIIKNINILLRQFFYYCMVNEYISSNPCDNKKIAIPKHEVDKKTKEPFSDEEIKKILNSKEETNIKYISVISLVTGMRKGEVLGLKESDIDFNKKEIHINRTVGTTFSLGENGKRKKITISQTPKTKSSIRSIPLYPSLEQILKQCIKLRNIRIKENEGKFNLENKSFIFTTATGELIESGNISKSWIYFLKRLNIEHRKFHCLRHTYATIQFQNNVPLKTVSNLLGHSNISTTADIYTHVMKKDKEKSIDILSL